MILKEKNWFTYQVTDPFSAISFDYDREIKIGDLYNPDLTFNFSKSSVEANFKTRPAYMVPWGDLIPVKKGFFSNCYSIKLDDMEVFLAKK